MIELYELVALLEDLPDDNLYRGQVGTVIEIYSPDAFEVEFSDRKGITYGLQSFRADQLLRLYFEPIDVDSGNHAV